MTSDHDDRSGPNDGKPEKPGKTFTIRIDRKRYSVSKPRMTGAELRSLAGLGADVDLFLEGHGDDDDDLIGDAETVKVKEGVHFFSTPRTITPGHG